MVIHRKDKKKFNFNLFDGKKMNHLQGEDNSIIRTRCSNKILVLFFTKYQKKINTLNSELSNCSMKNARDVLCVTLLALSISWDGYSGALI